MGRRAADRRLRPVAALAVALALVAGGCTARAETGAPVPGDGAVIAERLTRAAHDRDENAFLANFAGTDAVTLGLHWYRLMTITDASVSVPAGGTVLEVTWTLPGDRREAVSVLNTALGRRDQEPVITGVTASETMPLWSLESVEMTRARHGTVLASGLSAARREQVGRRLDAAAEAVVASGAISPKAAWDGDLVVELPADPEDFRSVSGYSADDTASATDCSARTPRISVSPKLEDRWFDLTLVHEAVHVATDAPCGDGYLWAEEGLAEWVTEHTYAQVARSNAELVHEYLARNGVPDALPETVETQTDTALAGVAVAQVFVHLGHEAAVDLLDRFARQHDVDEHEEARVTGWYLAALRKLARSR